MTPVCLLVHSHPSVVPDYEAALGIPIYRVQSRKSQLSAGYDSRSGIAATVRSVAAALDAYTDARPETPVVLIGFSAGGWAVRAWLRHEASRTQTIGAIFVDGLHAGGSDREAHLSEAHAGVLAFGRMALAQPQKHALIITHSDIVPPGYASTRRTAEAIAKALGLPSRPDFDASIHDRGVHIIGDEPDVDGDEGGTGRTHSVEQMGVGPMVAGKYVQPLIAGRSDTEPAPVLERAELWLDPSLSLGERCVLLARAELRRGVRAPPKPARNTSPRIAEYFAGCVRDVDRDGDEDRLGIAAGNWCMAFQSWLLDQCWIDGDPRPHLWRAGVVEAVADARKQDLFYPIADVRAGRWRPRIGDLSIWDRGDGNPKNAWWRHVRRLTTYDPRDPSTTLDDEFLGIGGNEARTIRETTDRPKRLDAGRLLGFISYRPRSSADPSHPLTDAERERLRAMIAVGMAEIALEAPWLRTARS